MQLCADNKLSSVHVNFCESDEAAALGRVGFLERLGYQYHWRNPASPPSTIISTSSRASAAMRSAMNAERSRPRSKDSA